MDFWFVLSIVVLSVLMISFGLGKLITNNIYAHWFFETKITRGWERDQLEKLRGKILYLTNFNQNPKLGDDIYKILKLAGAKVFWNYINVIPPCWELSLVEKEDNNYKFRLVLHRNHLTREVQEMALTSFSNPFSFLENAIVPRIEKTAQIVA